MIKIDEISVETRNHIQEESMIQDGGKVSSGLVKEKGRNGIALVNTSRGGEPRGRGAIDKQRERGRGKTLLDPRNPNLGKIHFAQSSKDR